MVEGGVIKDRSRKLQLHFDLNNTIIMMDGAKGLQVSKNLERIVGKSAWGVIDGEDWTLAHDKLTFAKPDLPGKPDICSYYEHLQKLAKGG